MKTIEEMAEEYLKSVGKLKLDGEFIEHNEHGFITFSFVGDTMLLPDLWGDGRYWDKRAIEIAKKHNCTKLRGGTSRNIKAYCKMFNVKVVGYIVEKEIV